jgi:hypothetical protein
VKDAGSITLGGALCGRGPERCNSKESMMNIPRINLDQIPGLDGAQALFGAVLQAEGPIDDRIVEIMVFLYESMPPAALI